MSSGDRFICGIEIHQQLNTRKLFCRCESELCEESTSAYFRRLRPTAGESGVKDRAAVAESKKERGFRYQSPPRVSCLVELDEEPPGDVSEDALDVVLTFAMMVGAKIVDEIHFMRKIVVDGSGTSGYQRTAMVAADGCLDIGGKKITIQTICLEEDSARKVEV
jgi:glutamyl-tRNA(Gln) amidotransferase subunit E